MFQGLWRWGLWAALWNLVAAILRGGIALVLVGCFFSSGCQLPGAKLEKALGMAADQIAAKIQDEGVLDKFLLDADGHVQDPGLESYIQVTIAAGVRAKGINGNIVARASGDSTRLPAGVREALLKELDSPNTSDVRKEAVYILLGWNRTPAGGTPSPPTPFDGAPKH